MSRVKAICAPGFGCRLGGRPGPAGFLARRAAPEAIATGLRITFAVAAVLIIIAIVAGIGSQALASGRSRDDET